MCIFCETDAERTIDHRLSDAAVLAAEACAKQLGRTPVTVVTGFLGAGKTTLVNWLLAGSHGRRFVVLQNEFGSEPIDDALVVRSARFAEVAVLTLASGCVCCQVRGDLAAALKKLAVDMSSAAARGSDGDGDGDEGGGSAFDAVVIETSGLSGRPSVSRCSPTPSCSAAFGWTRWWR